MKIIISLIIGVISLNCAGIGTPYCQLEPPARDIRTPQINPVPDNTQNFFLENGLEVFAVQNSASPMVCLNMTVKVGSSVEDYHTSGMSHMLEHLLFNGTETRTQDSLYDETDFLGAYSNAFTQKYFTDFMLLLPKEYLKEGMDIQSDMLFHSVLPAEKLEKERGIVIEEIRKDRDRETTQIQDAFDRMNFGSSGVGLPVIGTISTIRHMSREEILDFYHHYYVPNNMVLTVIGNFDPETFKDELETWYGDEAPGALDESFGSGGGYLRTDRVDQVVMNVRQVHGQILYPLPEKILSSDGFVSVNTGLGSEIAALAYQMIVEWMQTDISGRLPQYRVKLDYSHQPEFNGLILEYSADAGSDISLALTDITGEVARLTQKLPDMLTDENVAAWVKNKQVEEYSYLDQPHYYGMMKADQLAAGGGQQVILARQALTLLKAPLLKEHVSKIRWIPQKYNIIQPVISVSKTDETRDQVTYKKTVLPSGATLITSTGGGSEMMGMHILIKNRSLLEGDLAGGAEVLHSMLDSGTDQYTKEELATKLNNIGAVTKFTDMGFIPYDDYYNSPEYGYIRLECLDADAEEAIRLITHMMDATTITDEKVEKALKDAGNRLMMQRSTARETARTEFNKLFLGENHPSAGRVSGTMESLKKLNTKTLTELKRRYFKPENYIITVSSRLPHKFYADLLNSIWTTPAEPAEKFTYPISKESPVHEKTIEMGKEQAQILAGYKFEMDAADGPEISLMANILSDRMAFDLRETRGLAYSLGISAGHEGKLGWLTAYIGTGTENIPTALEGLKSYFQISALDDLTAQEIRKTINAGKGRYLRRNLTRIGQAFYMGYFEYYEGDYSRAGKRYDNLENITPRELLSVADKYLNFPDEHLILIVK